MPPPVRFHRRHFTTAPIIDTRDNHGRWGFPDPIKQLLPSLKRYFRGDLSIDLSEDQIQQQSDLHKHAVLQAHQFFDHVNELTDLTTAPSLWKHYHTHVCTEGKQLKTQWLSVDTRPCGIVNGANGHVDFTSSGNGLEASFMETEVLWPESRLIHRDRTLHKMTPGFAVPFFADPQLSQIDRHAQNLSKFEDSHKIRCLIQRWGRKTLQEVCKAHDEMYP